MSRGVGRRAAAVTLVALLAGGCATPRERVVLLPDAKGKVGKLAVINPKGETVLESAYAMADVAGSGRATRHTQDAAWTRTQFGAELDGLPPRPVSYTLYFLTGSDDLTPESRQQAPAILAEIARRPAAEVVVIGHTDRVGAVEYNDQLSLSRAAAVSGQLVKLGFDRDRLSIAGRGEREPLVATPDEAAEPRNRRAEINVR